MKFIAQSAFEYMRRQIERQSKVGGKLMFMMPSLPPNVVFDIGCHLTDLCSESGYAILPIVKVAAPLFEGWLEHDDSSIRDAARKVSEKGWCDEKGSLTSYRNLVQEGESLMVMLLIGVDLVTDASSMADFHHCDMKTIWEDELNCSFAKWIRGTLEPFVGYEDDTIQHFDWILQPLVKRGLADILQTSTLLQSLDLTASQDGRDAEKVILTSLGRFGLPEFGSFKFASWRSFGVYLDDALGFFSYDSFIDELKRQKALKAIDLFIENNPLGEVFDPAERKSFLTDQEFIEALKLYINSADKVSRAALLRCDFVTIRDRILNFRVKKGSGGLEPKSPKETVRKLSGGPIEVVLSAMWATLGEFKREANDRGVFAHEVLKEILIESRVFKHDCDGESADDRKRKALVYIARLLGGVDRFIEKWVDPSRLSAEGRSVSLRSQLVRQDVDCQSARGSEPFLQFAVVIHGDGWDKPIVKQFAWRLPEIQPYRVADELIGWVADAINKAKGYCLPVFHVPYYEELMLAKDDEETRRVLLQCIHDQSEGVFNLLTAREVDSHDPMFQKLNKLAFDYDHFIQSAKKDGLHVALLDFWDNLRKAYDHACDAYLSDSSCGSSALVAMLFRSFLIIARRKSAEEDRWVWETYEPSCAVTVLHPALIEMLQAHILYLLTSFTTIAGRELRSPGTRSFREVIWQGYVDLAAIHTPLSGLIKDRNRILDTDVRGDNLIHRIGSAGDSEASLTTRLLLRYDAFEDDDIRSSAW